MARRGVLLRIVAFLVAIGAIAVILRDRGTEPVESRSAWSLVGLEAVNSCLTQFDAVMFRGSDGKYRLYGDINRIQDIVDSPCREAFPSGAQADLDDFYANEVDPQIAACLRDHGVDAVIDPSTGPGIELRSKASKADLDRCFNRAYESFRHPPLGQPDR